MMYTSPEQAFSEYAKRKQARALQAELHPLETVFDDARDHFLGVGNPWTRRLFDGTFHMSLPSTPDRPACGLVFVQSRDGNTGADNPMTLGGGEVDKHLIYEGLSQVGADAVLSGAGTIRGGPIVFSIWHPELVRLRTSLGKPRHPIQIVGTLRGMDLERLIFNVPDVPVIVLTGPEGLHKMERGLAARPWVQPLVMRRPEELPTAFEALRARGIERITAVGGRHLATQLIDAGLVQDLYLTTSPIAGGEPGTPLYPRPLPVSNTVVRKLGTGPDQGVVFEHLTLGRGPEGARDRGDGRQRDVA